MEDSWILFLGVEKCANDFRTQGVKYGRIQETPTLHLDYLEAVGLFELAMDLNGELIIKIKFHYSLVWCDGQTICWSTKQGSF